MNNFTSIFEELSKLYEEEAVADEKVEEGTEELTEAAEDKEIEIVDDEAAAEEMPVEEPVMDEEPKQVICECDKCGALIIVDEADIKVDEETDLVNVEDECKFCEEAVGYKILGMVAPYEAAEVIEEGLFSKKPTHALIIKYQGGGKANNAKSDWYCFAMSSDLAKLKEEEASLKSNPDYKDVEYKIVDMKTAKTLVHKEEFEGAENLDEGIFGLGKKKEGPSEKEATKTKDYADDAWAVITTHPKSGEYVYASSPAPFEHKDWAVQRKKDQARYTGRPEREYEIVAYAKAKKLIGRPFRFSESLEDKEELKELLDFDVPVTITANDNEVAVGGLTSGN